MTTEIDEHLMEQVLELCELAGQEILKVYSREEISVELKADNTPVTQADLAAHRVLLGLRDLIPDVPLLSEEGSLPDWNIRQQWQRYWIIDPLDGTKEFINRNGEFTVNVALIDRGKAILGVVHVPVSGVSYCGLSSRGAWKIASGSRERISTRPLATVLDDGGPDFVIVASRRHGADEVDALMQRLQTGFGSIKTESMGSSLKLCLVAEGKADLYPRLALTSEWDTAAAQAVVEAAGGRVLTYNLDDLYYNTKEDILNPWFYVVGDPNFVWESVLKKS